MNAGIYHGSDCLLYIQTAAGPPEEWTAVGHATSHSIDVKSETVIRKTKSTGPFPTRKLVGIDASVSMEALVLYNGYSLEELLALQLLGTNIILKLAGHDVTTWGVHQDEDDWFLQVPAIISNNGANWRLNEDASFTAGFDLSGILSIETVPAPEA